MRDLLDVDGVYEAALRLMESDAERRRKQQERLEFERAMREAARG